MHGKHEVEVYNPTQANFLDEMERKLSSKGIILNADIYLHIVFMLLAIKIIMIAYIFQKCSYPELNEIFASVHVAFFQSSKKYQLFR